MSLGKIGIIGTGALINSGLIHSVMKKDDTPIIVVEDDKPRGITIAEAKEMQYKRTMEYKNYYGNESTYSLPQCVSQPGGNKRGANPRTFGMNKRKKRK